jgi:hypothetical protein
VDAFGARGQGKEGNLNSAAALCKAAISFSTFKSLIVGVKLT